MSFYKRALVLIFAVLLTITSVGCKKNKKDDIKFDGSSSEIADTNINLSVGGKSEYKIVVPDNCSETILFAANELTSLFEQSTGAVLPVVKDSAANFTSSDKVLSVGNTKLLLSSGENVDPSALNTDGFILKRKENAVLMAGGSENGTVYAVYEFLSKNLGYEFYAINETYSEKHENVKLKDFNLTEIPDFRERTSYYRVVTDSKTGNLRLRVGKGTEWGLFAHSTFTLIDPAVYKKDHRDWFSGWEHPNTFNEEKEMQLCLTNEDMRKELVKNLISVIRANPDKKYFMVGQMDKPYFCQCSRCRPSNEKYTNTGTMMRFINAVARDVKAWQEKEAADREIYIATFAYHETKYAPARYDAATDTYTPVDPSVVADDNVMVQFAPLEACFSHPLNSSCNAVFRDAIRGWKTVSKNIAIWSYCAFFSNYLVNLNNWSTIQENYQIFKDMNAMIVFDQGAGETQSTPFEALRVYISSKLLWNVNDDVNRLTGDFMKNYYKEVADEMSEYYYLTREHYATLEADRADDDRGDFCCHVSTMYDSTFLTARTFPRVLLLRMLDILNGAESKVNAMPDSPYKEELHRRVVAEKLSPIALLLELHDGAFSVEQLSSMIDEFEDIAAEVGLVHWSEAVRLGTKIAELKERLL